MALTLIPDKPEPPAEGAELSRTVERDEGGVGTIDGGKSGVEGHDF